MYDPQNIAMVSSKNLTFSSIWEEYEDRRHPEDGEMMFGKVGYVQATHNDGRRWRRLIGQYHHIFETNNDGEILIKRTADWDKITGQGEILEGRLNGLTKPRLNPVNWDFAGCVYGSEAYVTLGMEDEMDFDDELWNR